MNCESAVRDSGFIGDLPEVIQENKSRLLQKIIQIQTVVRVMRCEITYLTLNERFILKEKFGFLQGSLLHYCLLICPDMCVRQIGSSSSDECEAAAGVILVLRLGNSTWLALIWTDTRFCPSRST